MSDPIHFDTLIQEIAAFGVNLLDFALYTREGIRFHRFQPGSNCHNSYSVAKAFVVTALGLLESEGKLRLTDPIGKYLDIPQGADPAWQRVTIEHAVRHRIGFEEGFLDIDSEDTAAYPSEDYLQIVFAHPLAHKPGAHKQYSDAAYYLLSRLIAKAAGENLDTYLNRRIIRPLRFSEIAWSRCPLEHPIGATGLYIGAQDMVKLGALYLEDGVWQGKRLLPAGWTDTVVSREYEFRPLGDSDLVGKGGMYGQMLAFSRERGFAVAYHAFDTSDQRKALSRYLDALPGIAY